MTKVRTMKNNNPKFVPEAALTFKASTLFIKLCMALPFASGLFTLLFK